MQVAVVQGLVEKRLTSRERGIPEVEDALRAEATLLGKLGGRVTPRLVTTGDGFFHMENVAIPTVAARLEAGPVPVDPAWLARAARAAFAALAELHDAADELGPLGVVHADLSPANLVVDDAGTRAVLLDLGLAVWRDAPRRDGAFRGTVGYVAPEVARGELPTARSDLFALAATLLHAATGKPPRALSPTLPLAAAIAMAAEEPIVLAQSLPFVVCLAHDPAARPTSAREVLTRL